MSGLAGRILSRFPAHLEAGEEAKQLYRLVAELAVPLEQLTVDVGEVRRAHRLGDARVLVDGLRVAAFHGLALSDFEVLSSRFDRSARLAAALEAAADDASRDTAAEALCDLWGLAAASPRLPLFDPDAVSPESADLEAARGRLIEAAQAQLTLARRIDAVERRVEVAAEVHAGGNGTVRAVLVAAANLLDLDVTMIVDSEDRFWHAAIVRDRLRLERLIRDGEDSRAEPLETATEIIGLEENPRLRRETGATPRRHGQLFSTLRKGFETATLETRITGLGARSWGPMLVNRDQGRGIGYTGQVPDGATLVFTEEGRARLGDADVTADCFSFEGACFAGDDASPERDFIFAGAEGSAVAGKPARFVVSRPAAGLGSTAIYPHAGVGIEAPRVAVGETRFAFFVQAAHFSASQAPPRLVEPRPFVGFLDASVFDPGPLATSEASAEVELSWLEHEAYAVRLLLPPRFRGLAAPPGDDAPGFRSVTDIVKGGLQRFKPAGVEVRVEYVDDRWVLGRGVLAGEASDQPIENVRSGIRLWSPEPETL